MSEISSSTAWVKIDRKGASLLITGGGSWLATSVGQIDESLRNIDFSAIKSCTINLQEASVFDISGAWLIERMVRVLKKLGVKYQIQTKDERLHEILKLVEKYEYEKRIYFNPTSSLVFWIQEIGLHAKKLSIDAIGMTAFLGQLFLTFLHCFRHPSKFRIVPIIAIFNRVGLNAVPIISLISFLIGIVLIYQGAFQLRKFGAEIYTVDLLAISLLREIGILLTAIIVAGRSGSAFAAQLGTMKLNQEIDALNTFGLDPMEVLVVPRVIALVIAMPLLAFVSDFIGLAGGAIMSYVTLDITIDQYLEQLLQSFGPSSFWIGIIKAPVFGFIIAMVGCYEGMQVYGGAVSVGTKTTKAVVESIFLVIVMDAVFSVSIHKTGSLTWNRTSSQSETSSRDSEIKPYIKT